MSGSLLKLFLLLDYRDKNSRSYKKLIGIALTYIISNLGLSVGYFFSYDLKSFAFMAFSANMFLVIFLLFSDFANMFFAKENIQALLSYPLPEDEIKNTKFLSAVIFIAGFTIISSIPQFVFFGFYHPPVYMMILYPVLELLFTFFIASLFLLIYSFVMKASSEKANIFVYIIQFLFFFFIFSSTSSSGSQVRGNIFSKGYTNYLPQKLFVEAFDNMLYLIPAIILTVAALYGFYFYYRKHFFTILDKLYEVKQSRRKISLSSLTSAFSGIPGIFLKSPMQKAAYSLTGKLIFSTRAMRMRYIPMMVMPLVICIIGFFYEGTSYFIIQESTIPILNPSIAIILIMVMRIFISNLKIAEETSGDVEWVYKSLPIASPGEFYSGCIKYIYINFLLPLLIIMIAILAIKVNILTVLLNFIFIFSFMLLYNNILRRSDKEYPFTIDSGKINSMSRLLEILVLMFFATIVIFVQFLVFEKYIYYFISIIIILLLNFIVNKISDKKNGRTERRYADSKA